MLQSLQNFDLHGMSVAVYASVVAFLRIAFDANEPRWQRMVLEILLAALLAKGAEQIALALGYSHLDIAIGSIVGLVGVNNIRYWGRRWFAKKVDQQNG